MTDDLFEDGSMSFGEHIEELRIHLIRALKGLLVAFLVMIPLGHEVVKLITDPVEAQLKAFNRRRFEKLANHLSSTDMTTTDDTARLATERTQVDGNDALVGLDVPDVKFQVTLAGDEVAKLARAINPAAEAPSDPKPLILELITSASGLVDQIALPMATVLGKSRMRTLSAQEGFMVYFKAVLGAAIVVASPWLFYQIYSFISVGLYAHERRFVNLTLPFSVILFLMGVAVCFYIVFPAMLKFFLTANEWMDLEPEFRLTEWVGFAVMLTIIFGAVFQMPLLMLMLERVGIVTHDQLAGKRKIAILVNFCVAAMITPGGDPNTMALLALPMCVLYELGLFLMWYFQRRNPFAVESPTEGDEDFF